MRENKVTYFILGVILLLAAGLRFWGLEIQSLWNDELYHWFVSYQTGYKAILAEVINNDVHPPLDHFFLWGLMKTFGDSEFVLRLPSAIFGWLAVFFMWRMGREMYSKREGLLAAGLTAVLYFPVFYSQEARPYALLFLLAITTTCLWRNIINEYREGGIPSKTQLIGYTALIIIASYLHYFGLYLIVLQGVGAIILLYKNKTELREFFYTYIFAFLAYIPWLPGMLKHLQMGPVYIKSPGPVWFLNYFGSIFNRSKAMMALGAIFLIIFIVYFLKKKLWRKAAHKAISADLLLVLWLFVPLIIIAIKSIVSVPVLTYRNLIISLPAVILMVARGLYFLPLKEKLKDILAVVVCTIFLFHLIFVFKYYSAPQKDQFRQSVKQIVDNHDKYHNSLVIGFAWHKQYFDYYFRKSGALIRTTANLGVAADTTELGRILASTKSDYIWYISAHRVPEEQFIKYLTRKAELLDFTEYYSAEVRLLRVKREIGGL